MKAALNRAEEVLELTGLAKKRDVLAHNLSLLEDKRLEMARALSTNPKVLLLDEVMAGLRPSEALEAVQVVKQIRASGIAVLFIEHLMHVVRELADRVVVMNNGAVLAVGSYAQVTQNPAVIEAYLGIEETA
jgi:branched-chain amino acid transport system ATP-binding protein